MVWFRFACIHIDPWLGVGVLWSGFRFVCVFWRTLNLGVYSQSHKTHFDQCTSYLVEPVYIFVVFFFNVPPTTTVLCLFTTNPPSCMHTLHDISVLFLCHADNWWSCDRVFTVPGCLSRYQLSAFQCSWLLWWFADTTCLPCMKSYMKNSWELEGFCFVLFF